jgi:hypothetical protein
MYKSTDSEKSEITESLKDTTKIDAEKVYGKYDTPGVTGEEIIKLLEKLDYEQDQKMTIVVKTRSQSNSRLVTTSYGVHEKRMNSSLESNFNQGLYKNPDSVGSKSLTSTVSNEVATYINPVARFTGKLLYGRESVYDGSSEYIDIDEISGIEFTQISDFDPYRRTYSNFPLMADLNDTFSTLDDTKGAYQKLRNEVVSLQRIHEYDLADIYEKYNILLYRDSAFKATRDYWKRYINLVDEDDNLNIAKFLGRYFDNVDGLAHCNVYLNNLNGRMFTKVTGGNSNLFNIENFVKPKLDNNSYGLPAYAFRKSDTREIRVVVTQEASIIKELDFKGFRTGDVTLFDTTNPSSPIIRPVFEGMALNNIIDGSNGGYYLHKEWGVNGIQGKPATQHLVLDETASTIYNYQAKDKATEQILKMLDGTINSTEGDNSGSSVASARDLINKIGDVETAIEQLNQIINSSMYYNTGNGKSYSYKYALNMYKNNSDKVRWGNFAIKALDDAELKAADIKTKILIVYKTFYEMNRVYNNTISANKEELPTDLKKFVEYAADDADKNDALAITGTIDYGAYSKNISYDNMNSYNDISEFTKACQTFREDLKRYDRLINRSSDVEKEGYKDISLSAFLYNGLSICTKLTDMSKFTKQDGTYYEDSDTSDILDRLISDFVKQSDDIKAELKRYGG